MDAFWSVPVETALAQLGSSPAGLSSAEAARRLARSGPNRLAREQGNALQLLGSQLRNPLLLILVAAAAISAIVHEWLDAIIVLLIVSVSVLLGFVQEYRAGRAIEKLRDRLAARARVFRDGKAMDLPVADLVPGDLVSLAAGQRVPADGLLLDSDHLFATEGVLTGEPFPVAKLPGIVPAAAVLAERTNCLFLGSAIRSGTARLLIVHTGRDTLYGAIADRLRLRPPETGFQSGLRHFGYLLTRIMLALLLVVFAVNVFRHKPPVDSLLFAMALAVGLSPELLPAILTVTLARGAQSMAAQGVIVRRLEAIEDFGSMNVFCTDKTGTLTQGAIRLDRAVDPAGLASPAVLELAARNARFQAGIDNPLDQAILEASPAAADQGWRKLAEIPYDFSRRCLSILVENAAERRLITKGAVREMLDRCVLSPADRAQYESRFESWSNDGYRVLAVASRPFAADRLDRGDEQSLALDGFLLFVDPPRPDAAAAIAELSRLGIAPKLISGDNRFVAAHVAGQVGLPAGRLVTGAELAELTDDALWNLAPRTTIFAEVDPHQKERIIRALQKSGHTVGFLGDGINDAPALHAADVGVSVENAVDVAKEAADLVLIRADLGILAEGVRQGRRTFANTIKYILTTESANFGNMLSMAAASMYLPFLPLLAKQILLNNFLSDLPGLAIAGDRVDEDWIERPRRWDLAYVRDFMIIFGLVSSLFDFLTFFLLLEIFRAGEREFQSAWFVESLLTELVIALVVRTHWRFYRSRPGAWLLGTTLVSIPVTIWLPYSPFAASFGFVPLPAPLLGALLALLLLYVVAAEITKTWFFRTRAAIPFAPVAAASPSTGSARTMVK